MEGALDQTTVAKIDPRATTDPIVIIVTIKKEMNHVFSSLF
jgi:hypothetical protein